MFWFAENGAAAPGAGQMSYLWKVKLEKRNDIFWLRDKETNSIQTNKEEIGGGCRLWKNLKTYSSVSVRKADGPEKCGQDLKIYYNTSPWFCPGWGLNFTMETVNHLQKVIFNTLLMLHLKIID